MRNPTSSNSASIWRKIRLTHVGLLLICLLLPFCEVSCAGGKVSATVGQTIVGSDLSASSGKVIPAQPDLYLAGAFVTFLLAFGLGGERRGAYLVRGIAGACCVVFYLWYKTRVDAEIMRMTRGAGMIRVDWLAGYWILFLNSIFGALTAFWAYRYLGTTAGAATPSPASNAWVPPPPPPVNADGSPSMSAAPVASVTPSAPPFDWAGLVPKICARITKKVLIGASAIALVCIAAWGLVAWMGSTPGRSDYVRALNSNGWGETWAVSSMKITDKRDTYEGLVVDAEVTGSLRQDAFVKADTDDWIQVNTGLSIAASRSARAAVASPSWGKISAYVKAQPPATDITGAVALKKTAKKGGTAVFSVKFSAGRARDGWVVQTRSITAQGNAPVGHPRSAFAPGSFDVDSKDEVDRIKASAKEEGSFAEAFKTGYAAYKAEMGNRQTEMTKDFLSAIAPGRLFAGEAKSCDGNETVRVFLEFTEPKTSGSDRVAALLREDTGWMEARLFTGTWKFDEETGACSVQIKTNGEAAIRGLSPCMSVNSRWELTLNFEAGTLTGSTNSYKYHFELRTPEQALADQAEVEKPLRALIEATSVGSTYVGTISTRGHGSTYDIAAQFTKNERNGTSVDVVFSDPNHPSIRRYAHGQVLGNTKLGEGRPLRLTVSEERKPRDAGIFSVYLGDTKWAFEGNTMRGESDTYIFELTRSAAGSVAPTSMSAGSDIDRATEPINRNMDESVDEFEARTTRPVLTADQFDGVAFPSGTGAYLWMGDRWVALPRNDGKLVPSVMGQFNSKVGAQVGEFKFTGTTPVPVASGSITIFFRGAWNQQSGIDYPIAEMSLSSKGSDGGRRAPMFRVGKGLAGFHTHRAAGAIEVLSPNTLIYRGDSTNGPGSYVFMAGQNIFEVSLQ